MPWYEKNHFCPYDEMPIQGLFHLDGDILAREENCFTDNLFRPMIAFPSGMRLELTSADTNQAPAIILFGEMSLPINCSREEAFDIASDIAELCNHSVQMTEDNRLVIKDAKSPYFYFISFDEEENKISDVVTLIL